MLRTLLSRSVLRTTPLLVSAACSGEIANPSTGIQPFPEATGATPEAVELVDNRALGAVASSPGAVTNQETSGPATPETAEPLNNDSAVSAPRPATTEVPSCNGKQALLAPKLRRLSELQLRNSLTDIYGDLFDPQLWPSFEDGARLIGMNLIADKLQVNSLNFSRLFDASRQITRTLLTEHPDIRACAQEQSSDGCVMNMVDEFAPKTWRRQLSSEERAKFETALPEFADNAAKLEFVFNALILSSEFLFRSEMGTEVPDGRALSNEELVSFLSYAVWNSTPDQELLELGAQTEPLTETQLRDQIDRMIEEPRAKQALVELYKDYLKLDLVLEREKDSSFGLHQNARRSLLASAERSLAASTGADVDMMQPFFGSEYYVNQETAAFFGVESYSDDFASVSIEPTEREGILNHPAFLSVHSKTTESGIIQRGVFTLEQLLCTHLPDPPSDLSSLEPPAGLNPERTSERDLLLATHSSRPACNGCHQLIDPAGFGFENFDAAGRYRTTEKQDVPIDASGELRGVGSYRSSAEFSRALATSDVVRNCVTRRFLEHFVGQELREGSCELQTYIASVNDGGGDIRSLLTALTQLPSTTMRRGLEEVQ